ncbi:MAG: hypothetical protein ACK5JC_10860 [Bacteroidota bacterium]
MFLLIGLLGGLVIGGVSVRLYTDKVYSEKLITQNVVARLFGKVVGMIYSRDKNKSLTSTPINQGPHQSISKPDTLKTADVETETADADHPQSLGDTTHRLVRTTADENIVVLEDQLLSTRKMIPVQITGKIAGMGSDSLLAEASGIKQEKISEAFIIEFWQSPLNFRGYKMGKNKIVLYGIDASEPIVLYRINQSIYLNFQRQYVKLEVNYDYKSFEKITDAGMIALLEAAGGAK